MGKTSSKPKTKECIYTYQFVPGNDHEVNSKSNNENNDDNEDHDHCSSTSIIQNRIFDGSKEHSYGNASGETSEEESISTHSLYDHFESQQHDCNYIEPGSFLHHNNIDVELTPPCNPNHVYVDSIGHNYLNPPKSQIFLNPCPSIVNHPMCFEQHIINNLTKENLELKKLRQTYRNQFTTFIKIINRQETEIKQLKIESKHEIKMVNVDLKTNDVQQNSLEKDRILDEGVDKIKTILVEMKDYVIGINKKITTKTMPKRTQEKFGNVKLYMEQFDNLHGRHTQFIKSFNDFNNLTNAILNYNIHCKETNKILYVLCKKQGDGNLFRQVQLVTDDELKKLYLIQKWQLPKLSNTPKQNSSELEEIRNILQNKNQRDILIKSTRWTKITVHKWYLWNKKSTSLSVRISSEEFIKNLQKFADKDKGIILIPIIEPHELTLQFAWVILLNINDIEFHIGISLKLTNSNKNPIKISSIFVNLFDVHHLVQFHHKTENDTFNFHFRLNDLDIGRGKLQTVQQTKRTPQSLDMSEPFDVNVAPYTVPTTKSSLNPHCNEFFPGVTSWEHTTKLSVINEESNTNL